MSEQNWIYDDLHEKEFDELMQKVEAALGFKLFVWQKIYIRCGNWRRSGRTTAEILRQLLNTDAPPLDYSERPRSIMEDFCRKETLKIKEKLDNAGIETRKILFTRSQKIKYLREQQQKGRVTGRKTGKVVIDEIHPESAYKNGKERGW